MSTESHLLIILFEYLLTNSNLFIMARSANWEDSILSIIRSTRRNLIGCNHAHHQSLSPVPIFRQTVTSKKYTSPVYILIKNRGLVS